MAGHFGGNKIRQIAPYGHSYIYYVYLFEEWVWKDAGIGNVYPKFKPPSSKNVSLN